MPHAFVKLKSRLKPWNFPNCLRNGPSKVSSSSPVNLVCKLFLSSLILRVLGSSQHRFVNPATDAVAKAARGPPARLIGAVKPRMTGDIDCIWKKIGKTLFCKREKFSLSSHLNARGEATYE